MTVMMLLFCDNRTLLYGDATGSIMLEVITVNSII